MAATCWAAAWAFATRSDVRSANRALCPAERSSALRAMALNSRAAPKGSKPAFAAMSTPMVSASIFCARQAFRCDWRVRERHRVAIPDRSVAGDDVGHLLGHRGCDLGAVVGEGEQPPRHVKLAIRHHIGIDGRRIEDGDAVV